MHPSHALRPRIGGIPSLSYCSPPPQTLDPGPHAARWRTLEDTHDAGTDRAGSGTWLTSHVPPFAMWLYTLAPPDKAHPRALSPLDKLTQTHVVMMRHGPAPIVHPHRTTTVALPPSPRQPRRAGVALRPPLAQRHAHSIIARLQPQAAAHHPHDPRLIRCIRTHPLGSLVPP